jgi:outer membrane receptor for ferrienterochelin and colicin
MEQLQEISFNKKIKQNDFVAGINHVGENYQKDANDSTAIANYDYQTYGVFLQDGIHFSNAVMAEAGIRFDYHNQYHSFFLRGMHWYTSRVRTKFQAGSGNRIQSA